MNDQLQQALLSVLSNTVDALKAGTTFLLEQLPDVIRQLLMWKAAESALYFGVALILAGLAIFFSVKMFRSAQRRAKNASETSRYTSDDGLFQYAACAVLTLVALTCLSRTLHNLDWLQILIAPKIYLIEYAASLVHK